MNLNIIPHASSDRAPAVLSINAFGARNCVAWKNKGDSTIWFSTTTDNVKWSTPEQIKGSDWIAETEQGPALAEGVGPDEGTGLDHPTYLYAAWTGKSSSDIWYSRWNGKSWSKQAQVGPVSLNPNRNAQSHSAPSLTTVGGGVAMAWRALDGSIHFITFPTGVYGTFGAAPPGAGGVNETTDQAPAIAGYGDGSAFLLPNLMLAWVRKSDNTLWYTNLPGAQPANLQVKGSDFTALSSAGPAICTTENSDPPIGLAWIGESGAVWVSKNFPTWQSPSSIVQHKVAGVSTNVAPAWSSIGNILVFVAHKLQVDSDVAVEDGSLWTCTP